jgi:hypothetical protein
LEIDIHHENLQNIDSDPQRAVKYMLSSSGNEKEHIYPSLEDIYTFQQRKTRDALS